LNRYLERSEVQSHTGVVVEGAVRRFPAGFHFRFRYHSSR